ncbi:hypothetical protein B0H15DRAFT_959436 [Mycena belliarum]|uniref:Mediator of RNA polymerase II transcription subunit 19 n=1 Tax=Mycena belliarum TaxID=1033014 RepID=A0AAD6UQ56_9AGAR|nr:hypothetical protein B0H15DRAFT_959436 [Mycena belliae]
MSAHHNAEAGPSTALFLAPPGPSTVPHTAQLTPAPGPPQPQPRLASTQDLLARFRLLPAYDKYVRAVLEDAPDAPDNGKGKAREQNPSPAPQTPGGEPDPDDDDPAAKGEKKKKNSYKHLIKGAPGKHSMKKDDYLAGIMQVPPKQRIPIVPFDLKTQREAFSVSLDGIKGWNTNTLVLESAQAREDRKKRKELKRLAKAQAQLHAAQAAAAAAGSPAPVHTPGGAAAGTPRAVGTPRPGVGTPRPGAGTPRPGAGTPTPRPGEPRVRPTVPPVVVPQRPVGGGGAQTPTSALRQGTGTPTSVAPRAGTPHAHPFSAQPLSAGGERGTKRERETDGPGGGGGGGGTQMQNVQMNGAPRTPVPVMTASKAGIPGVRPRPLKKQRMDMQGQARDVVQQQPTPQGV